jgi:hypothetical protein
VTWAADTPAPFGKSSPANAAFGQPANPTLGWETSSSATSYEYCIDTSSNNTCDTSWISTSTSTSVPLSGLAAGGYSWQVRARNASGTTEANAGAWWSFLVGQGRRAYLPLVLRNFSGTIPGIVNGDFESGLTGWTEYSTHGWPVIVNSFSTGVTARSGSYAAWLGGDYDDISYVQQQVTISAGAPYLVYWHWIASSDACSYDFGKVMVNGSQVDVYNLCSSENTGGWVKHSVNLSAYIGYLVMVQIRAETDDVQNSNLFVDDVSLQASASAPGQIEPAVLDLDAATTHGKAGNLAPGEVP